MQCYIFHLFSLFSTETRHSYEALSEHPASCIWQGGEEEGWVTEKETNSSTALQPVSCVCMQTHLHLGGPCVCGALLSEGTIPYCVLLSCRCQLCPLNSYVSLCKVSVQPCGRKLSSESILLCFHNPFCYKSLTATPNQTPLSQAYPEVTSLIKHKTYQ